MGPVGGVDAVGCVSRIGGQVRVVSSTEWAERISKLDDETLAMLVSVIREEQRGRALAIGDPDAVADSAFTIGFDRTGLARDPWLVDGVVICPGGKVHRSKMAHRCRFVHVTDGSWEGWVWEHFDSVIDLVRYPAGFGDGTMQSMTLIPAVDGIELDVVTSKATTAGHAREKVSSFRVERGELVSIPTSGRNTPQGHR